jgi:hypothetical protein
MTSTPGQQPPDDPPVIVIDGVPRSAADLKALAHDQVSIRTAGAATLARATKASQDDEHALEVARLQGEIDRLGEDLGLRIRDFQDCTLINAQLQDEIRVQPR